MAHSSAAEKSPDAFRTISEVAVELDTPQHVLRFWESKFSAIKPMKRGGGRRYYRPEDLDLLRGIRTLLYGEGLTIKGVQKIFRDQGMRYVTELGRGAAHRIASPPARRMAVVRAADGAIALSEKHETQSFGLTEMERTRISQLLDELLELKAQLRAARKGLRLSGS